jgi:hypothetical protein
MKLLLSKILYTIGDIISRTTMVWGNGYGFNAYNKIMLMSVDLDNEGKIWKHVKPKNKRKKKNVKKNSRLY